VTAGAARDKRVAQYMTTDIFTVQADDAVDRVANLMGWERIRHVPVEDQDHRLIGLVSYRSVLRNYTSGKLGSAASSMAVSGIMKTDVITVTPQTPTLEAIATMRRYRIGCLPVAQDGKLVGMLTEENFLDIAAELLEQRLNG
jgi:CBS domain-containing protein